VLDVRTGDLLEPVHGELFDLVVSNPPFVIGPSARYTYRDAGRDGDDLCRSLVADLPGHLVEGGTAVLLANWLHLEGEDGDARVQSWFGSDVDGWVVQRELVGPEDYVTAWLRDTDEGGRFDELYDSWTDWFALRRVEAVAFGVLALRRGSGRVHLDDVPQPVAPVWGDEVTAFFARQGAVTGGCSPRPGGCGTTCGCTRCAGAARTAGTPSGRCCSRSAACAGRARSTPTARRSWPAATAPAGWATCWRCSPAVPASPRPTPPSRCCPSSSASSSRASSSPEPQAPTTPGQWSRVPELGSPFEAPSGALASNGLAAIRQPTLLGLAGGRR
jgi:hypothetical protein